MDRATVFACVAQEWREIADHRLNRRHGSAPSGVDTVTRPTVALPGQILGVRSPRVLDPVRHARTDVRCVDDGPLRGVLPEADGSSAAEGLTVAFNDLIKTKEA